MSLILPINVEDLLHRQGVESSRIEFKASWDPKTTGFQVLKTICAFANDLQNLNGGYIIIGVAEDNGRAVLPPQGISAEEADKAQKFIRKNAARIDPVYQPIMSVEHVDGRLILILWVPGSETRPHRAPDGQKGPHRFYVRLGSETVDAEKNGVLDQLIQLTAKVPFDDRRTLQATVEDLRLGKVREFLSSIRSGLLQETSTKHLYRKLRITTPVNGHDAPKNIGLLMFSDDPELWFPGARIEVVEFADGASGNLIEEKYFRGSLHEQLKNALSYLEGLSSARYEKQERDFQVKGWVSYPIPALREALVNAVYHRGYDTSREPTKVYLYPDRIVITSYPGPAPGIQQKHLRQEAPMPLVPARNRRIGEFLKELRLAEGRGTGLPKIYRSMRDNGSQDPQFDFDEQRTYFSVTLPAHPEYVALAALRDAAYFKTLGQESKAFDRIKHAWQSSQDSPTLTAEHIRLLAGREQFDEAVRIANHFQDHAAPDYRPYVTNVLIEMLLEGKRDQLAEVYLAQQPEYLPGQDSLSTAILARRLGNQEKAHQYFERAGDAAHDDVKALHEFAQTKMKLATKVNQDPANKRLLTEAKELLEHVIQMQADRQRHAWAWRDLARVKTWLNHPGDEINHAFQTALERSNQDPKFLNEYQRWKDQQPEP